MVCKKCGTQLPDNARFCGNCGASFDELTSSMTNSANSTYHQKPIYNNVNITPVKKKGGFLPAILIIIGISVIGGIIYGVIHSLFYDSTTSRRPTYSSNSSYTFPSYSSSSKDYNDESSIQQTKFSVDYVKEEYLDGYESKTIGTAFNNAFGDVEWEFEEDGTKQYVNFFGTFESKESTVMALVIFVHDPSEDYFWINAVSMVDIDDTSNKLKFTSENDIRTFLDWVYNGVSFKWTWDTESDIKLS